jgi:hypothetical protein
MAASPGSFMLTRLRRRSGLHTQVNYPFAITGCFMMMAMALSRVEATVAGVSSTLGPWRWSSVTSRSSSTFRNSAALAGRLLLAAVFLPAGFGKVTGFEGTVGYIASVGLPMASAAATLAAFVEIAGSIALIAGAGTRLCQCRFKTDTLVTGLPI